MMTELSAAWQITWSTLQQRRASLLTYAGIAAAFHFITAVALPSVGGMESVETTIKSYSPAIQQLLKISPTVSEYSLQDHFSFTWLHPFFIGLCAAFVVGRSAEALAGDIESGAVYLVLCRPVPRWTLVLGRLGEVALGLAVILLTSWLALIIGIQLAEFPALPLSGYARLVATAWCLFMAISVVALIASSLASRSGIAAAIGTIWALSSYVLDVLPAVASSPIAWINPWHHYFPPAIVAGSAFTWMSLLVLLTWIATGALVATLLFGRRDLV
jgi:ABC-type transport system involved in multi-copper enzyme maturation permease subunit